MTPWISVIFLSLLKVRTAMTAEVAGAYILPQILDLMFGQKKMRTPYPNASIENNFYYERKTASATS